MRYFLIVGLILSLFSCSNNEEIETIDRIESSSYFPLNIGFSTNYQVEEIIFNKRSDSKEVYSYQLKEEVADSFTDDTGNEVYTIDRYTRNSDLEGWAYQNSWQAMISENQAIRIEDNRRYIKLRLPITQDDQWDGNALFDASAPISIGSDPIDYFKNWSSKLVSTNSTVTIGDQNYNDVHIVSLAEYENKLELRLGIEEYAKGIGLIYREIQVLDTQCFNGCDSTPWEEKAENGHIYIQRILN